MSAELVCAAPFAPLRDGPDEATEQHTQVLFGDRLAVYREAGEWLEVTVPDGYRGYVQAACAAPWDGGAPAHAIVEPEADGLYLGTWLSAPRRGTRPLAERRAAATGEALLEVARSLLATPYEWGGTTVRGIDCSGLVQTSLRSLGTLVPRNADQQRWSEAPSRPGRSCSPATCSASATTLRSPPGRAASCTRTAPPERSLRTRCRPTSARASGPCGGRFPDPGSR